MASSLTPAYIRIAGPSTSQLSFTNSTITYTNLNNYQSEIRPNKKLKKLALENIIKHLRIRDKENSEEYSKSKDTDLELKRIKKHLEFKDSTEFDRQESESKEQNLKELIVTKEHQKDLIEKEQRLEISHGQWNMFVNWAKDKGFDLVFALNNENKNPAGLWDPNSALDVMSMAAKANVSEIYWQLGYGEYLFL